MQKIDGIDSVYVGGPMRGIEKLNFEAFNNAEKELRQLGYKVNNPAAHDVELGANPDDPEKADIDLEEALHWDLQKVLESDALVLLPGWEDSRGATLEHLVAKSVGKPTFAFTMYSPKRMKVLDEPPYLDVVAEPSENGEVRTTDPDTGGQKGVKLARFDLLPADVMWELAEHYGKGAQKYAERNWELGYDWSKSFGAMQRHVMAFWMGEDIDPETGSHHLIAAMFHCGALIHWGKTHPEKDDRPGIGQSDKDN